MVSQLYGIYRPQRPDTLLSGADGESLARYLVQEVQLFGEVHPDLLNHIDYAAIGRELETSENYLFTDNGIFYYR
ncbi:Antirestriction protein (ArdA) [human gut metagenome]|uniref:Antirestriction protein (ArdA) n=1 Tax=human gut metagenome TaxID=408170 RepID=K1T439_9ZZZZ